MHVPLRFVRVSRCGYAILRKSRGKYGPKAAAAAALSIRINVLGFPGSAMFSRDAFSDQSAIIFHAPAVVSRRLDFPLRHRCRHHHHRHRYFRLPSIPNRLLFPCTHEFNIYIRESSANNTCSDMRRRLTETIFLNIFKR